MPGFHHSVAVSPFCHCKIPLFCKNYVRKFCSITAVNSKKIRNGSSNGNSVRKRQWLTGTAKWQRKNGNRMVETGHKESKEITCLWHGFLIWFLERVGPVNNDVAAKHTASGKSFLCHRRRLVTVKVEERKPTILLLRIIRNIVDNNVLQAIWTNEHTWKQSCSHKYNSNTSIITHTHSENFNDHLLDKLRLTSCPPDFSSPFVLNLCILSGVISKFHNLHNTVFSNMHSV